MRLALLVLPLLLGAACSKAPPEAPGGPPVVRYVTDKPFADVVEELEFAITERNFRITGYNKVGSAMRRVDRTEAPRPSRSSRCPPW